MVSYAYSIPSRQFKHMQKIVFLIFVILVGGGFTSCQHKKNKQQAEASLSALKLNPKTDFSPDIRYAKGFRIKSFDGGQIIELLNPWKEGEIFQCYCVLDSLTKQPAGLPENCIRVRRPIKKIAILSSTHVEPIDMLHSLDAVCLVSNGKVINNLYLQDRIKAAKITDLKTTGMARPDAESLLEEGPDLVFISGFESISPQEKRMMDAGLKLCFVAEWMETCPLARAEWIKFFAAFLGKDQEAEQEFNKVVKSYHGARQLAQQATDMPTVLLNYNFRGTWYVPGGESYVARLVRDAGADYYWKKEKKTGSLPMSFECVLDNQQNADFWLNPGAVKTLGELSSMDERYSLFEAFNKKQVFNNNKRLGPGGGNDWWESGVMHPDIILKDMIRIFHPELLPRHDLYYFRRLL